MSNKEKTIDKIRKLLALANSSNEHEAALAAAHAQRILSENNLSMSDIDVKEAGADCSDLNLGKKTIDKWIRQLFAIVAESFDCAPVSLSGGRDSSILRFIGCGDDPAVAMHTTQYLIKTLERLAREFVKTLPDNANKPIHRRSYLLGAVRGIYLQLREQKIATPTTSTALVPVKEGLIKTFLKDNHAEARPARSRTSSVYLSSFERGKVDGRSVRITKGIAGAGCSQTAKLGK